MLFSALGIIAVALTCTMFATRERMLGYPCVLFYALLGAYAYTQSTEAWGDDIWFYMFFACMFGMTTFCAMAMYSLREKRDTLGDEAMEDEEGERVGEGEAEMGDEVLPKEKKKPTARERMKKRREGRQDRRMGRYRE